MSNCGLGSREVALDFLQDVCCRIGILVPPPVFLKDLAGFLLLSWLFV